MDVDIDFSHLLEPVAHTGAGEPAVAYYRYSSRGQTEQSIEGQQAAAKAYAKARGYNIIHEYADRAMTGRNDDREQFQQMLSDAAKRQFKVIILWKIDRFGRNREEIAFNKHHCKKYGVRVEYVAETVPPTPEGVILESVLEGMAEYYSLQLSQNIRRGQRISAAKCQSVGGNRPLGYKTGPDKKFEIDPETAPTVQTIFRMYAAGNTTTEIVNYLNDQGLRTLRGHKFNKNSLRTLLSNEKYIGVYTYKDEVRVEGGIPAIIDKDTFYAVQKLLKVNQRAPARRWSRADYLLTDKLFCGACGSGMVGESGTSKSGRKHNYYLCTKHKRERACKQRAVRQEWIEDLVLDTTIDLLRDDALLDYIADRTWAFYQEQDEAQARVDSYTGQLGTVNKAIQNIVRAIENGMDPSLFTSRLDTLGAEKAALETAIAAEELDRENKITKDMILFFLHQFRDHNRADRDYQKWLVEVFVNSVFVYEDQITVTFNYGAGNRKVTLHEVDSADPEKGENVDAASPGGVFDFRALCSTKRRSVEPLMGFDAFALSSTKKEDTLKSVASFFCLRGTAGSAGT